MAQDQYPTIRIRVSPSEYKRFQLLRENGYSAREILEKISPNSPINIISKKTGEPIQIPPNIICKKNRN